MCRMMGAISSGSLPVEEFELFGNYAVSEWSPNGKGHADGWGIYTSDGQSGGYAGRDSSSAYGNLRFLASAEKLRGKHGIAMVHIRNASCGTVRTENSHPFVQGRYALAHNGTIKFPKGSEDVTDSELLFRHILGKIPAMGFRDALVDGINTAREAGFSGLVLLATDGETLYGFRDYTELPDYYTLSYCSIDGGAMISQVRSNGHDWTDLRKGQLLSVRSDGSLLVEELA